VRSDGCAALVYHHCPSCQRPDQRHGPAAPAQRRGLGASATDLSATESELLIIVALFVVINLVVDLLYSALDPRVRLTGARA